MQEIWKDIYLIENGVEYDYRCLYQVSSEGRVKSLNFIKEKFVLVVIVNKNNIKDIVGIT